jgi:hypothetical protein
MNILVWGAALIGGPIYSSVILVWGAALIGGPIYSSVKEFYFFTTDYFSYLPGRGASKIGKLYSISHTAAISHTYNQIHNIVYDKQNKFDNYIVHSKRNEN